MFDASPLGIAVATPDGKIESASDSLLRMSGFAEADIRGRDIFGLHPAAYRDDLARVLREAAERGAAGTKLPLLKGDGKTVAAELSAVRLETGPKGDGAIALFYNDLTEKEQYEQALERTNLLIESINDMQSGFIADANPNLFFNRLLDNLLDITASEFGFIGDVKHDSNGDPYLWTRAISDVAWNEETRKIYEQMRRSGAEFRNLKTLFGVALTSGRPVISNDPANDPRSGGLPPGHPPLKSFLGIPYHHGGRMISLVGLANRPGGYSEELVEYLEPLLNACANVTNALQSEEARQASEQKFRALFDNSSDGILLADPETKQFIEGNAMIARMLGYRIDEIPEIGVGDIHPEEELPYVIEQFERQARGEIELAAELPVKRKDGSVFYADINASPVTIAGRPLIMGSFRDVTRRRQAEEDLRHRKRQLEDSQRVARLGSWSRRLADDNVTWSDETYRLFRLDPQDPEPAFGTFLSMIHPNDRGKLKQAVQEAIASRGPYDIEVRALRADGTEWLLHARGEVVLDGDGNPVSIEGTAQDITDIRRTEAALRESEERYSLLFRHMNEIAYFIDISTGGSVFGSTVRYVSDHARQCIGYAPEEFVHDPQLWFSIMHPDDGPAVEESTRKVIEERGSGTRIYRLRHKDTGEYVWLEDNIITQVDADGHVTGLFGVARDITERRHAEDLLVDIVRGVSSATGQQFFASLVKHLGKALDADITFVGELSDTGDAIDTLAFNLHGKQAGNTSYRLAGTPCENVVGKELCVYPSGVRSLFPEDRDLASLDVEGYIGMPLFSSEERPIGVMVAMYHDPVEDTAQARRLLKIFAGRAAAEMERLRSDNALRRSEEKYRALFEESKDAVFITSIEGRFLDANPACVRLLGYPSLEELLEIDIEKDLYEDPADRRALLEELSREGSVEDREVAMKGRDGRRRIVSLSLSAIRDAEGNIVGTRGVGHDITEKRLLEEQLMQAQKLESIGTLAGGVAHDFNNLLMAIEGYADIAMQNLDPGKEMLEILHEMRRAAERGADLTRQLLIFSRKQEVDLEVVSLNDVIINLMKMLNRLVGDQHSIVTDLAGNVGNIKAALGHMEQVITNLVVNARDAMPEGGEITVKTESVHFDEETAGRVAEAAPGEYALLSVADSGTGMDETVISQVFDPFFSTKESGRGTGLGLSVVYGIVENHGGWIEIDSTPGAGTVFSIYLPTVAEKTEDRADSLTGEKLRGDGEAILLVEDDDAVRAVTGRILSESGYAVTTAATVGEALDRFRDATAHFDMVFSDVNLPDGSGVRLAEKIREMAADMPILLVSGFIDEPAQKTIADTGFRWMQKPYSLVDLLREVKRFLE